MKECIDIKKMWYIYIREYYSAFKKKKRKEVLLFATTLMK